MDALGFGPLLEWLWQLFADVLGVSLEWLALPLTYLAYGFAGAALLTFTRRAWRYLNDRWLILRGPLRRIRREYGSKPAHAFALSKRLFEETGTNPLIALAGFGQGLLWFVVLRNAMVPWQDAQFRAAVGQQSPTFFGLDASLDSVSGLTTWITVLATALIGWFTVWSIYGQKKERMQRRAWLIQDFPPRWTVLVPLAWCAGYLVLLFEISLWVPSLPVSWTTLIIALITIPANVAARRQDRPRYPIKVRLPEWVWHPALPAPTPKPRTHVVRRQGEAASPQPIGLTAVEAPPVREPVWPPPGTTALLPQATMNGHGQATTTALPQATGTRVLPLDWAALAPTPTALNPHEPRSLGPYTITGRIGAGGMAIVYLATSGKTDQVALKVTNPLTTVSNANRRLVTEIQTLARVADPAIVEIHDAGVIGDHPYLAMEYLHGPTLHEAVHSLGPLSNRMALRALAEALAQGLAAIHRVGIHRDLKPANIILTDSGPVIVDLGIAKLRGITNELTREGVAMGTVGYTAPEILHAQQATPASDVFAWAACVAFAAAGRPLFGTGPLGAQLSAMSAGNRDESVMHELKAADPMLAQVVRRASDPDPQKRPSNGDDLLRTIPRGAPWTGPSGAVA